MHSFILKSAFFHTTMDIIEFIYQWQHAYHFNKAYNALQLENRWSWMIYWWVLGEIIHTVCILFLFLLLSGIISNLFFKWWKWWDICTVRKMLMTMIFINPYCQWEKHLHETQSLILFCLVCSLHLCLSQTSSFFHRSHSQSQSPELYIRRIRRSSNCHLSHSYQHHHSWRSFSCLLGRKTKTNVKDVHNRNRVVRFKISWSKSNDFFWSLIIK